MVPRHHAVLGAIAAGSLVIAAPCAPAQPEGGPAPWRLVSVIEAGDVAGPAPAGRAPVASAHPTLAAELRFTPVHDARAEELRVALRRGAQELWEKPAPSDLVFLPAGADLVVMVGKTLDEGHATDGKAEFRGLSAWNAAGERVAAVDGTGIIERLVVLDDGRAVVLSAGTLRLYDLPAGGGVRWSVTTDAIELRALAGGRALATEHLDRARGQAAAELRDVATGALLRRDVQARDASPHYFGASGDGRYALLRTNTGIAPPVCTVGLVRLDAPDRLAGRIDGVAGGPVAGDRTPTGLIALASVGPAPDDRPGSRRAQIDLTIRDGAGRLVFSQAFDLGTPDLRAVGVAFAPDGASLTLRLPGRVATVAARR